MSITQQVLDICMDIIKNSIIHDLPYAKTVRRWWLRFF